jgi:hypothetical protein
MTTKLKYLTFIAVGLLFAGSFFSSCYYDNNEELYGTINCDTVDISYTADILPILENACLTCHNTTSAGVLGGGNNLEGFDNLSNYIIAGDAQNSTFYASVAWIPGTSFMPQGSEKLSSCNIAQIRSWINGGATNN